MEAKKGQHVVDSNLILSSENVSPNQGLLIDDLQSASKFFFWSESYARTN